jgi:ADP-ribose pyrophosphatase
MTTCSPRRTGRVASAGTPANEFPANDSPVHDSPANDSPASFQIADSHLAFTGYYRIHRYLLRHRLFRGGWSSWITREVFERRPTVAVLLYDPFTDQVVLLRQFRMGALTAGKDPWQVEIVAGVIEQNETPEAVARREAYEEAGAPVYELLFMHDYVASPGPSTERTYMYCALLDCRGVGGVHGVAKEQEDIAVDVVPFVRAWDRLRKGEIENAPAILALQWLAIHRGELRSTSRMPV